MDAATPPLTTRARMWFAHASPNNLRFSLEVGNDLSTPRPEYRFKGLKAGDRWCVCAMRWREALLAGVAPPVVMEATHQRVLDFVTLEQLQAHAYKRTSSG